MVSQDGRESIGLGALPDVGDPGKPGSVCESHTPATRLLREDPRCECDTHRQSQPPSLCYPRPRPIDRSGHSPWRSRCRQDCPRWHLAHEFGDHDPIKPMLFLGLGTSSPAMAMTQAEVYLDGAVLQFLQQHGILRDSGIYIDREWVDPGMPIDVHLHRAQVKNDNLSDLDAYGVV